MAGSHARHRLLYLPQPRTRVDGGSDCHFCDQPIHIQIQIHRYIYIEREIERYIDNDREIEREDCV